MRRLYYLLFVFCLLSPAIAPKSKKGKNKKPKPATAPLRIRPDQATSIPTFD